MIGSVFYREDPQKIKRNAFFSFLTALLFWGAFFFAQLSLKGYIGAAIIGAFLGISVTLSLTLFPTLASLPRRICEPPLLGALTPDGITVITGRKNQTRLIPWSEIDRVTPYSRGLLKASCIGLRNEGFFLSSLGPEEWSLAKANQKNYHSPVVIPAASLSLSPKIICKQIDTYRNRLGLPIPYTETA